MPSAPIVAWLDGRVVPFEDAKVPIEDRGLQFGESLYEVVAVTRSRARLLSEHALRMRRGARFIGIESGVPDSWQEIVDALQAREQLSEGLLIAQVTGGTAPRTHVPPVAPAPTFFCYLRAFSFPREDDVADGIRAVSSVDLRWGHSDLKTTMLLPGVLAKRRALGEGAREALLLGSDGVVHEGAASNVFLVEGRTLVTPEQDEHLLPGLTRPLVGRLAAAAGLGVQSARIPLERLRAADEVFVTSTTFLVMPVTHVDGEAIGSGKSGPVARDLAARLRAELELE